LPEAGPDLGGVAVSMQDDEDVVIAKMVISQATALLFCGVI
jgi:hypothetical protein